MQDENGRKKAPYRRFEGAQLRDYIQIILIRKWLVLLILLLFIGVSILYLKRTEPEYQSQVLMIRKDPLEPVYDGIFGSYSGGYYYPRVWDAGQELLLRSTPLVAAMKGRLLDNYNMDLPLGQIRGSISMAPYQEDSDMVQLTAYASIPEQAQALANVAAETYMEKVAGMKRAKLNQGLRFLERQMEMLEEKIQEVELAINDFREERGFTFNGTASSGLTETLVKMQEDLAETEGEIDLAKSQLLLIEELISEKKKLAQSSAATEQSSRMDQLQERLISLEIDLNTLLETLTGKDPEVINLQTRIDVVRRQLKTEFDKLIKTAGIDSLDPIAELQSLIQQSIALNVQLRGLERKAELITARIKKFRIDHPGMVSKDLELKRLERQARMYEQAYAESLNKYEDMRLQAQMITSGLEIVDSAPLPQFPISPNKRLTITLGILIGLTAGIGAAFFLEYLDDSIKRKEDVERFLEMQLMGAIPKMEGFDLPEDALNWPGNSNSKPGKISKRQRAHREKTWQELLSHSLIYSTDGDWRSPGVESYRNLAFNIRNADVDNPPKSLLVTSAMPREGKTITATNLAIIVAQSGIKTLLVDADLRRPNIHRIFHQERAPGLTDLLVSDNGMPSDSAPVEHGASLFGEFIRPTEVENLYIITSGGHVSNPGNLLPSEKMQELTKALAQGYDMLIFDSPPLGLATDAIALSTQVDGTLIVIYSGETKRKIGLQAKESLENVNAQLIGAVLNNVDYTRHYGDYYYGYKYYAYHKYYTSEDDE